MSRIYNIISIIFLLLTIGTIAAVVILLLGEEPEDPQQVAPVATRFVAPTPTDTPTPSATFTVTPSPTLSATASPTNTLSPTPSVTPLPSDTLTPSITTTPSLTLTPSVTPTPTPTFTPTSTFTPLPTATPTGPSPTPTPTDSPFLFGLRNDIEYRPNTNVAACNWQSIAGSVLNFEGQPAAERYNVRVFNNFFEQVVQTGTNSLIEPISGWEIQVSNTITMDTFFVRLESLAGTPISANIEVTFPQDCAQNVAVVRFAQTRPRGG